MTLHPTDTTNAIREAYLRYLKTIKPFQDPYLRAEFTRALQEPNMLVKGPYLEITPPFATGLSIKGLVAAGVLSAHFQKLCYPGGLNWDRPLYLHQERAVRKVCAGRNIVVTTGTGSGKTETFLIPILDYLLREEDAGTLANPGVRALLLYPMNALANDQMERLRQYLAHYPKITFGRYVGETQQHQKEALEDYQQIHGVENPPQNELISREAMQACPPHLLLTNYAMLEYLLLRPADSPLFDNATGQHWHFIALDEAHVYDGARATEIGMLLRRLQDRVIGGTGKTLQAIATSATMGDATPDSLSQIIQFANVLFNLDFKWESNDPDQQDIVLSERVPESQLGKTWGHGTPQLYATLAQIAETWRVDEKFVEPIASMLTAIPPVVLQLAHAQVQSNQAQAAPLFLYEILRGDQNLQHLRALLRDAPCLLAEVAAQIFTNLTLSAAQTALADLISAAILARADSNAAPLLPARYHVFARALEGAFVCLNTSAMQHQGPDAHPTLFLTRHKFCPHCGGRVFELANCTRCGESYLIGDETPGSALLDEQAQASDLHPGRDYLIQNSALFASTLEATNLHYFVLDERLAEADEDAYLEGQASGDETGDEKLRPLELCPRCGALYDRGIPGQRCPCGVPTIKLSEVDLGRKHTLKRCVSCSTYGKGGIIYRFLTGQDAPVSVLAGALYQHVPAAHDEKSLESPGQGRKMLVFTDNRQQAAFFAPYLERAQERNLRRRLMVESLLRFPPHDESLTLQDWLPLLLKISKEVGVFAEDESLRQKRVQVAAWLMQEFSGLDKRLGLEGVGLLQFRPVRPAKWQPPAELLTPPWQLSPDEAFDLLALLLNTLRRQGAVTYLLGDEGIDLLDEKPAAFAPRARPFYVREQQSESSFKYGIYSWLPSQRYNNGRLDLLTRWLLRNGLSPDQARQPADDLLKRLWGHLTGIVSSGSSWLRYEDLPGVKKGKAYRLRHDQWEVLPTFDSFDNWYICPVCQNLSPINLRGVCPTYGCKGILEPLIQHQSQIEDNLYRYQYRYSEPLPLSAQEHTAQWKPKKAAEIQKAFIKGITNVLSCSTTFELGVDVGDLNAVVLRNVPPSTANYVQRAGRAGRRTDSVALVLTFAQRRPHDLTFYEQPERMIAGKIRPPVVVLQNEKIIRRHLHSVAFAAFFRWAQTARGLDYRKTGDFFTPADLTQAGPEQLRVFLESYPVALEQALGRIIPPDAALRAALDLVNWGWVNNLVGGNDAILDKATAGVRSELEEFQKLEQAAASAGKYDEAIQYQRVQRQIQGRDLLGYLGTHNVLPKYGFPSDVVQLQTDHLPNISGAVDIELDRDLKIAIAEFAPGGQVVAAKRIWYSQGIRRMPDKKWPPYAYAICSQCKRMNIHIGENIPPVCICGQPLSGTKQKGIFIVPEHGFIASSKTDTPGEQPPERIYASRIHFSNYSYQDEQITGPNPEAQMEPDPAFSAMGQVFKGYSRYGWLAVVNDGYGQGFHVCSHCGYSDVIDPAAKKHKATAHKNPLTGKDCNGALERYDLGHRFMTDVLELRLSASIATEKQVLSLLYALLSGASDALDIQREDIDGVVYYRDDGPAFVLFDTTPGGSGHVKLVYDHLHTVFEAAYRRVSECNGCGPETSCYSCLRSYRNQFMHDKLERGLAWTILGTVLNKPLP